MVNIYTKVEKSLQLTIKEQADWELQRKLKLESGVTPATMNILNFFSEIEKKDSLAINAMYVLSFAPAFGALVELVISQWHIVHWPEEEDDWWRYACFQTNLSAPYQFYVDGNPEEPVDETWRHHFSNIYFGEFGEILQHLGLKSLPEKGDMMMPFFVASALQEFRKHEHLLE